MPLYIYECESCGAKREVLRPMSRRKEPAKCWECGGRQFAIMALPAKRTDGIYSYAENLGDADKFDRWHEEGGKHYTGKDDED